ncbi:unnamed protein product [Amaranthus hypochondriacus]
MDPMLNVLHLLDKVRAYNGAPSFVYDTQLKEVNDRVHTMSQFMKSALTQIRSMGGLAALDNHVLNTLHFGVHRLTFLRHQMEYRDMGLLSNDNLLKWAKDVLKDLPQFLDPERDARDSVKAQQFIIDRTTEREEIVHLLLQVDANNDPATASVVPILGISGSGKTSLALLVYHDIRITNSFDYQIWVDVSGIVHGTYDLLGEVRNEYFRRTHRTFECETQKWLIVLDDFQENDPSKWFQLFEILLNSIRCKPGCKILVTSRCTSLNPDLFVSMPIAKGAPFLLRPPRRDNCLALFKSIAFKGIEENLYLKDIGLQIFDNCADNLHAIRTIAFILSSDTTLEKWKYLNFILNPSVDYPFDSISLIVHLIRNQLIECQSLFNYDSKYLRQRQLDRKFKDRKLLLDRDFNDKVELKLLQKAQKEFSSSFFEKYFQTLLRWGNFVEDISRSSKTSVTVYYKVGVLMHEVMKCQHLVRDDIHLLYNPTEEVDHKLIRHVSFIVDTSWEAPSWLLVAKQLKTLHFIPSKSCSLTVIPKINEILENNMELRALDLAIVDCRICLNSIGKLTNLRYLRLGASSEVLPECLTYIKYLHTLDLRHSGVQQLPDCFHETLRFSLKQLYVGDRLIDLPPRFEEFSNLQTLDVFIVGKNNELSTLVPFARLSGKLKIRYQTDRKKAVPENEKCLAKLMLNAFSLVWSSSNSKPFGKIDQKNEALEYEFLQPPPTVKNLVVQGYNKVSFPRWAMNRFSLVLSNLVSLHIKDCNCCQYLPSFSSIPNLEYLRLCGLDALEWIENCDDNTNDASSVKAFFPSLKFLELVNLLQLKGWEKFNEQDVSHKVFKSLSELRIAGCPHLMLMPLIPRVETLRASNIHAKLLEKLLNGQKSEVASTLKELHINSVHELESLLVTMPSLQVLTIRKCKELINVGSESTTLLRCIEIQDCSRLKHILPVLHNLFILEELKIENCQELNCKALMDDIEEIRGNLGAVWKGLKSLCLLELTNIIKWDFLLSGLNCFVTLQKLSLNWDYKLRVLPESIGQLIQLQCLAIRHFPNLVNLPESLGQLSSLQNMEIQYCPKLKQLPQSFHNLKTLRRLEIRECILLKRRCQQPDGEDWPVIEHIPNFLLK